MQSPAQIQEAETESDSYTPGRPLALPRVPLCDRRHGASPPRRWRDPRAERSRFAIAPRSVDATTPDSPRGGPRWLYVCTRTGRSHHGYLPAIARLRARPVDLRRRTGRARRRLISCGVYAFGNFELLTASSAATPSTESLGQPRTRRGAPPTPPPDPGSDSGGSANEPDSWLYQSWKWVLWSLWSWCGPFCWRIGTAVRDT